MSETDFKLVAAIRKATKAALHKCKDALKEAKGNVEVAIESLKKMGYSMADKKSGRPTSEGCIVGQVYQNPDGMGLAGLLECQCETDFVSKNEVFVNFAKQTLEIGLKAKVKSLDELLNLLFDKDHTVEQARKALVDQIGENVRIRRYQVLESAEHLGLYVHQGRYGCIVALQGGRPETAKDIAVHIVVSHPNDINELFQQDFYKDHSKSINNYLKENAAKVVQYIHFALGKE